MSQDSNISDERVAELAEVIRGLMGMRHRFKPLMPEEVVQARARLHELLPQGTELGRNDFDLFFSVGAILIRRHEPMTMGELSQSLDVPLSTATRLIDQMVKYEYAQRLPDPDDRRVVRIALTEMGQKMYQGIHSFFDARMRDILGCLDVDEQANLIGLMRKVLAGLKQNTPG